MKKLSWILFILIIVGIAGCTAPNQSPQVSIPELKECISIDSQDEGYFKCNNSIYYGYYMGGKYNPYKKVKIDSADLSTFESLDSFFGKDKNKVYCLGEELKGADSASFKLANYTELTEPTDIVPYGVDKDSEYNCLGKIKPK